MNMIDDPKDIRILHIMAGATEGGAENIFLESVLALDDAGFTQHIVTRPENTFRIEKFTERGIGVDTAGFTRAWPFPTRSTIAKTVRQFKPNVAEYWMRRAGQFTYTGPNKPISCGWYGGYYQLERFKDCEWHIALTEDIRQNTIGQGASPDRVEIIHTYAEFEAADPITKASLDTPEDAPVILCLARLHWKKGLDIALEALKDIPQAYMWIAGDGPLEGELKALCTKLGLDDRVRFLGWRNDRGALLATADICCFPSRYEPFGTVTVDSWAAGTPLVAAASQGPAAYVKDGHNGLLVPIDSVDALREAMQKILTDADLRAALIKGGTETYQAQFNKAAFQRDSLAFYKKILRTGRD